MSRRRRRAVIVITRDIDVDKQWTATLGYCAGEHLVVEALTRDPDAAITLVQAGFADLVVAASCDERRILLRAPDAVPVVFLREPRQGAKSSLIADMLNRGGTPELVAQLLAVPLREVEAVASGTPVRHYRYDPARRPRLPDQWDAETVGRPRRHGDPASALRTAR